MISTGNSYDIQGDARASELVRYSNAVREMHHYEQRMVRLNSRPINGYAAEKG